VGGAVGRIKAVARPIGLPAYRRTAVAPAIEGCCEASLARGGRPKTSASSPRVTRTSCARSLARDLIEAVAADVAPSGRRTESTAEMGYFTVLLDLTNRH